MRLTKNNVQLGMGVTIHGWTDCQSYTVVKISGGKNRITLQRDNAERITKPEFISGGFGGVCVNNREIKYDISPNPDGFCLTVGVKKNGEFWNSQKPITVGRYEFYDYNF